MNVFGEVAFGLHTDVAAFKELLDSELWASRPDRGLAWDESALPEDIVGWEVEGEELDG